MKLLITTQAVDKNEKIQGFIHQWIEEFSKHFEHIHVVCLFEGEHTLPKNVTVHSLGKEKGESKVKYIFKFYTYMFRLHSEYDAVFVHMNPHYIVLYGIFWKLCNKKIFFWRNHARMNWMTRFAALLSRRIFYTSPFACTARYKHAVQMPVGIDTHIFSAHQKERTSHKKILVLGRISPVKRVELMVQSAVFLPDEYTIDVYGDAPPQDRKYFEALRGHATTNISFKGSVRNDETPDIYKQYDMYINLTPKGSMDKTVFEAASCGSMVLFANESFLDTLSDVSYIENPNPQSLANKIVDIANLPEEVVFSTTLHNRDNIVAKHSLKRLATTLSNYIYEK